MVKDTFHVLLTQDLWKMIMSVQYQGLTFYQHAANVSEYPEAGGDESGNTTHPEIDKPAGNFFYLLQTFKILQWVSGINVFYKMHSPYCIIIILCLQTSVG